MPTHKTDGAEVLSLWSNHGMTTDDPGRPRDPNQDPAAVKRGRPVGVKGGKARVAKSRRSIPVAKLNASNDV